MQERKLLPFETFRGDFLELAEVMRSSWGENKQPPLLFTDEFLRSALEYPGSGAELTSAVYPDGCIAAFCAAFPRTVRMGDRSVSLVLNTFVTVAGRIKGTGHGVALWCDIAKKARQQDFEGMISFCVDGDAMQRMMPVVANASGLNYREVYKAEYLSRFLRPVKNQTPRSPEPDIELFLALAAELVKAAPLSRSWTREEAIWQCRDRSGAIAVTVEQEGRRGMLTGYSVLAEGKPPVRVALLEDLLWGNLNEAEQFRLLQQFLAAAAAQGAQSASCPVLGYSSVTPLIAAGFRPSKRVLHTWLALWNGMEPEPLSSIYIDVF